MGVLDKLLFWRTKTTGTQLDIEGCFTLPGAEIGADAADTRGDAVPDTAPKTVTDAASATVAGQVDQVAGEIERPKDQVPAD